MQLLKKLLKVLNEELLTMKEMGNLAVKAHKLSKSKNIDLDEAVRLIVDSMIENNTHPAVTSNSRDFTIFEIKRTARRLHNINEEFDVSLTKEQMLDILNHAKMMSQKSSMTIEDAILDQLEDVPGAELLNHDEVLKQILALDK